MSAVQHVSMTFAMTPDDDVYLMEISTVGPVTMQATADGQLFLNVNIPIPPGFFKFQKSGGLMGPDGKPLLDVASGIAGPPTGKLAIKKSGLTAEGIKALESSFQPLPPLLSGSR